MRDYLHKRVTSINAPIEDRPFLRASAADTLNSGKGYCGEVTRTFICLADAVGIRAQRINLYGKKLHVVAEAEVSPGKRVIVDCQDPPQVPDMEPLDKVILHQDYDDYSTLNLRRLRLNWLVSRIKLEMGPLTFWSENPHALKAGLWSMIFLALVITRFALIGVRSLLKRYITWRGWVRVTDSKYFGAVKNVRNSRNSLTG